MSGESIYISINHLATDSLGYKIRLITYDELPIEKNVICTASCSENNIITEKWLYNSNYLYWTMSEDEDF